MTKKDSLFDALHNVLTTADACEKANLTLQVYDNFNNHQLVMDFDACLVAPDYPARPEKPELVAPAKVPFRSKGVKNKPAFLHAIAHIELNAIDLACDMVVRFASYQLPPEFYTDWLKVAYDEARHFNLLNNYLKKIGYEYGDFPAHNSLWEAAYRTKNNLAARLAVIPMVLEARGLDVTPKMITEFEANNDYQIAKILSEIYHDEINHVYAGVKWFEYISNNPIDESVSLFHTYLQEYFTGSLMPPFNQEARDKARIPRAFYENFQRIADY